MASIIVFLQQFSFATCPCFVDGALVFEFQRQMVQSLQPAFKPPSYQINKTDSQVTKNVANSQQQNAMVKSDIFIYIRFISPTVSFHLGSIPGMLFRLPQDLSMHH